MTSRVRPDALEEWLEMARLALQVHTACGRNGAKTPTFFFFFSFIFLYFYFSFFLDILFLLGVSFLMVLVLFFFNVGFFG